VAGLLEDAQPLVLSRLKTSSSRRQFSRALQYAGRIRSSYLRTNQSEAVDAFDQKIDEVLANAPYRVPARIRRAYGLASDTAAGPSGLMSPPTRGGTAPQPAAPSAPPN
jgi:hypothetical protein